MNDHAFADGDGVESWVGLQNETAVYVAIPLISVFLKLEHNKKSVVEK
jgi:hypothetical protein